MATTRSPTHSGTRDGRGHLERIVAKREREAAAAWAEEELLGDQAADQARREGRAFIRVRPRRPTGDPDEPYDQSVGLRSPDGRRLMAIPGEVEFINMPGRVYDHRVTVATCTGIRTQAVADDITKTTVDPEVRPHAYIESVAILRRPGGIPFTEQTARREWAGELRRLAIQCLIVPDDGGEPANITGASVTRLLQVPKHSTKRPPADPLEVTLAAYQAAVRKGTAGRIGRGYRSAVSDALRSKNLACSDATVKNLLRTLRDQGRIAEAGPGRPAGH